MRRQKVKLRFRIRWLMHIAVAYSLLTPLSHITAPAHAGTTCYDSANFLRDRSVRGRKFMVAAAHPLAVEAGCNVLSEGGNAVDAAVAVQMVLAVVEPQSSGLAGGSAIMYWDNKHKQVRFFEGLAKAPQTVPVDLRTPTEADVAACGVNRFRGRVNNTGRAFGVPGTPRVLQMIHNQFGTQNSWSSLFNPAIELAENGFPMPPYMHTILRGTATARIPRCKFPDLQARYCRDETTPMAVNTTIRNPELATTLRIVRDGGADAFYDTQGPIAQKIIERVTQGPCIPKGEPATIPSLMTVEDFGNYEAKERSPVCGTLFDGYTVCSSAPPAFGGTALLYMLNLMEQGDIGSLRMNSFPYVHLFIESSRLAQIDRRQYIGDPDFNYVPIAGLLDPQYLQSRFDEFSWDKAIHSVQPGTLPGTTTLIQPNGSQPETPHDMTSHVSIVDAEGNALSMTTTVNSSFGAQMEAAGMILNNVQNNFTRLDSISPGDPVNHMKPHKKPRTSLTPTLVFDPEGRLKLVVGAAGGSAIPEYVAQVILGVVKYGMNPQRAMNQDHISGQWITSVNGERKLRSELESDKEVARWLDKLQALGHPAARTTTLRSGLTAIEVRYRSRNRIYLYGAADKRRDGVAMGR